MDIPAWRNIWPCYSCCKELWIPSLGQFGPHCVGIVGHIPSWTSLLILVLRYGFGPLWMRRPTWLRKFAVEDDESDVNEEAGTTRDKRLAPYAIALLASALSGVALGVTGILTWQMPAYFISILPNVNLYPDFLTAFLLWLTTTQAVSGAIILVDRPQSLPGAVFLIQSVLLFVQFAILAATPGLVGHWHGNVWSLGVCIPLLSLLIMLNAPMRDTWRPTHKISKAFANPTPDLRSPEDNITLWQWMTVSWMAPLISIGKERQLHDNDIWSLPYEFQHDRLHRLFRDLTGSVLTRLLKANGPDLIIVTLLGFLETFSDLVEPVLLKQLLTALAGGHEMLRVAFVYAGLSLMAKLVKAQSGVFSIWFSRRAYERSRGEMITMIYEKTLRRKAFTFRSTLGPAQKACENTPGYGTSRPTTPSQPDVRNEGPSDTEYNKGSPSFFERLKSCFWARKYAIVPANPTQLPASGPASTGKILNLMRNDVYEVAQRFWEFASLFTKPLGFILSIVLIWRILGPASLSGIIVLLAGQVVNVFILRAFVKVQTVRRAFTDAKLQLTSQFVEAIRHLRWYAWQDAWLVRIFESRQAELAKMVLGMVLLRIYSFINSLTGYLFPLLGFLAYTLISGKPLTVDIAFPALTLFSTLQNNLRELPDLVTVLLNAKIAMDRIESFLAEPDTEGADVEAVGPPGELQVELKDATFAWPGSEKRVLQNVSIQCKPGLHFVCGKVGSGKTALLQAILGELDQLGGERRVPTEMIGYSAQSPWLQSMSIRENILFCAEYDETRYLQVLDACCLLPDLVSFEAGDLSFIGENGVGLSGGQKARVALARAIYSRARILLLDDPISALDHQTADTILRKLFAENSALMGGRLVIFVSHRVDLLARYADQVLDISEGGRVRTLDRAQLESNYELHHIAAAVASQIDIVNNDEPELEDKTAVPDEFIEAEHRAHGGVMASVYWRYAKAGKLRWWTLLVIFSAAFRLANILYFWFLKEWGQQYGGPEMDSLQMAYGDGASHQQTLGIQRTIKRMAASGNNWLDPGQYLPSPETNVRPWLFWFFVLSMVQVFTQLASEFTLLAIMYEAAKELFQDAMRRVSGAKFRFYDVTPVGRLMNRLTSDMGTIDGQIASQLQQFAWYTISWLSAVFVIGTATPSFLLVTAFTTSLFVVIFMRFLPASQSLRRLETVSLSPLMSNFGTLLEGLTTVRAFRAEPQFQQRIITTTDAFQQMDHFYWSLQAWLQFRFDILAALSTFTLTATAALSGLSGGLTAFVLASASTFVSSTHALCRRYGELQMQFVSVERVVELLDLEQEDHGKRRVHPSAAWPTFSDDIVFDNVTLRYAPNLEPSLVDVSLRIPAGSSVAMTGRTGSGKSTLALSLLGTVHPDADGKGAIYIGGVDLATVDKEALRRRVTFVAQDPVLFPGTLRDNLDPLHEHTDVECAGVLKTVLGSMGDFNLETAVDGGGKNLSQGQRQLVGLGRAILRRSPVVILDEATASIDYATAQYIQEVLREELKLSTVITIAHRVEAVRDANYCVLLDTGRVVYSGPPREVGSMDGD